MSQWASLTMRPIPAEDLSPSEGGTRSYFTRGGYATWPTQEAGREQRSLRARKRNYAQMEGSPEISGSEDEPGGGLRRRRGGSRGAAASGVVEVGSSIPPLSRCTVSLSHGSLWM